MISDEIFDKVWKLHQSNLSVYEKTKALHVLIDIYMEEVLEKENLHFTTLFTKISYLCLKYKFPKRLIFFSHLFRKQIPLLLKDTSDSLYYDVAKFVIIGQIQAVEKIQLKERIRSIYTVPVYKIDHTKKKRNKLSFCRVHIFEISKEDYFLIGIDENFPEEIIKIKLNELGVNDNYNSVISFLDRSGHLPASLHLENVEIEENGTYIPSVIILEPDYLIDITTISECFKPNESNPLFYFIRKFFPVYQNKYLIIGNTANFFLDEIFNQPDIKLKDLLSQVFAISPLGFSLMDDQTLLEVVDILKIHYYNIRKTVKEQFPIQSITNQNAYLEPSFYSPKYGIQGRLDLFAIRPAEMDAKIVELKSGKAYKSNAYGLNINHYVQTLLYDLMVSAVFNNKYKISNFILYSAQTDNPLKFAPPLALQQKEALKLRNELVEIDYLLASVNIDNEDIFRHVGIDFLKADGFAARDIETFQNAYRSSSSLMRKYFNAFTAFVAKEQILAKTGEFGLDKSNGLAGLWLDDMEEKIANFRVLNDLKILDIQNEAEYTRIEFSRTELTSKNANFRVGDLGVLYLYKDGNSSAIRNQIFKCSIIQLSSNQLTIRLRNKQSNLSVFSEVHSWNIEHDHLDHGFNVMYQDLFRFMNTDKTYHELLLGRLAPPKVVTKSVIPPNPVLTVEQNQILIEMLSAEKYYLLWGPPGTGKTSAMLRHYIEYTFKEKEEVLLVIAYTNRAVDEICEAIENIGSGIEDSYLRIGSRYSTSSKFKKNLLVEKLKHINNRNDLRLLLSKSRIIVSTLASIQGKKEIFSLIKFDAILVDEASQILEPQIIGLLSMAPKFVLIGDHNQLPAIVIQKNKKSKIEDKQLNILGISDRRNSLFERLYKRCEERGWNWVIGSLNRQGRMHNTIMEFVNKHFYNDQLKLIENIPRLSPDALYFRNYNEDDQVLATKRLIYIPSKKDNLSTTFKSNHFEARIVAHLCKKLIPMLLLNDAQDPEDRIGVITPYRAQISAIKADLESEGVGSNITVDTVERYQGGSKDIIIISLCLNIESQMKQLVSSSSDGIDRKLNVALTRAKEHLIIIGNEAIMKTNETYGSLINGSYRLTKL